MQNKYTNMDNEQRREILRNTPTLNVEDINVGDLYCGAADGIHCEGYWNATVLEKDENQITFFMNDYYNAPESNGKTFSVRVTGLNEYVWFMECTQDTSDVMRAVAAYEWE